MCTIKKIKIMYKKQLDIHYSTNWNPGSCPRSVIARIIKSQASDVMHFSVFCITKGILRYLKPDKAYSKCQNEG